MISHNSLSLLFIASTTKSLMSTSWSPCKFPTLIEYVGSVKAPLPSPPSPPVQATPVLAMFQVTSDSTKSWFSLAIFIVLVLPLSDEIVRYRFAVIISDGLVKLETSNFNTPCLRFELPYCPHRIEELPL